MERVSARGAIVASIGSVLGCGYGSHPPVLPENVPPVDWRGLDGGTGFPDAGFPPLPPGVVSQALGEPVASDRAVPLTGGTLLVLSDGVTAVASDPDRDRVWIANTQDPAATPFGVALNLRDEPGRLVEDNVGHVHVATRRGGVVVTLDPQTGTVLHRRWVCAAPRGITWDPDRSELLVACGGGELVTLSRDGDDAQTVKLDPDLRDVMVWQGRRYVTHFRSATLSEISRDGRVVGTATPPTVTESRASFEPDVAWRTFVDPTLGIVMLHQAVTTATLSTTAGAYGAGIPTCTPATVNTVVTRFSAEREVLSSTRMAGSVLAIDGAVSGQRVFVASPALMLSGTQAQRMDLPMGIPSTRVSCVTGAPAQGGHEPIGQIIAVAVARGEPVYQVREPAGLLVGASRLIAFPDAGTVTDTGHSLFHLNAGGGIACASCHPEGGDDGRVWSFARIGRRRTPAVRGAVSETAPFHWDGDEADFTHLLGDVFARRMSGGGLTVPQVSAVARWVDRLPTFPTALPDDAEAVTRGRRLFESDQVGCSSCHAGPNFTNNQTVDVGTGGAFQVPPLRGLVWRAPYMHDGSAPTIRSRVMMDSSGQHGHLEGLTTTQREDLARYLETL